MVSKDEINYSNYILKNPLYIHNHKKYFEQTLSNLNKINPENKAKDLYQKYLKNLQDREEDIIKRLGGGEKGEAALKKMADESFVANKNIKEIIKKLEEIFYMNKDIKVSVYREGDDVYLRLTGKGKGNKRIILERTKLVLKEIETVRAHGRDVNNYDYIASAKNVSNNMQTALMAIVQDIQNAIGNQNKINDDISKLVNTSQLSRSLTDGPLGQYVTKALSFKANSSNEELLQFIIEKLGTYIALKGQFTEAAEIEFSSGIKELFEKDFHSERGDTRTHEERQGTFKKPDLILSGGKIDVNLNPITISMKTINKKGNIKVQNSPLMGDSGGIYQAFYKDNPILAKTYLYLMLNNSYYNEAGSDIINLINRYMSYIFISGNFKTDLGNKELPINQALYLVINEGSNDKIQTSFIPISNILISIVNGEKSIKITNTKKSTTDLSELWGTKIFSLSKKYNNSKKAQRLNYKNLYNKTLVIDKVKDVANSLLTRDRKVEIKYDITNGIIS